MILNDATFIDYGGQTGTSTPGMRTLAYQIAEQQVQDFIGYPLAKQQVTGTYSSMYFGEPIALGYTLVESLDRAELVWLTGSNVGQRELVNTVFLLDNEHGIVDTQLLKWWRDKPGIGLQIVFTAGLESGTFSSNPLGMAGLVAATQIVLNELMAPGQYEGRVGIQEFTNMKYSEKRYPLRPTVFGSSAAAQYVQMLLSRLKKSRVGRL